MIQTCPHCGERIAKAKRKRIAQALPGPSRKAAKEAKRAKHAAETARIRADVWEREAHRLEMERRRLVGEMSSPRSLPTPNPEDRR